MARSAAPSRTRQPQKSPRNRAKAKARRAPERRAVLLLLPVAILLIVWPRSLVGLFTAEADVLDAGAACLRIIAYGYGFYAFGMVMTQAFNGAGDTITPTVINFFCYWCFQLPLAWLLAMRTPWEARGVFAAITIAEVAMTVVAILVFRRGTWQRQEI